MVSKREEKILKNARALREKEHMLHQPLRLTTLAQAEQFVMDRGLVSVLGGNELPSIVSAFLGREWTPGRGFSSWLEWWSLNVSGERLGRALSKLERSKVVVPTRIFRRSKTLVSRQLWPSLTPIVKHFSEEASSDRTFSKLEESILELIGRIGPIRTDKLKDELNLHGKTDRGKFHLSLSKLESYALIVGSEDPQPERHIHANIWSHWKSIGADAKRRPDTPYVDAISQLFVTTLDAAVLAPEKDVGRWFRWKQETLEAKEKLLNAGKIIQAGNFLVTPRAQ